MGSSGPYPAPQYSASTAGPYPAFSAANAAPFAAVASSFAAPFAAAAAPYAAEGAKQMAHQAQAEFEQDTENKMRKLFGIPMEAGLATPYMLRMRHWMHVFCIIQAVLCGIRFAILLDIMGGFWMVLVCLIGWYAWWKNMNVTYVSAWGLACFINGIFDSLGVAIPLAFDALEMNWLMGLIRFSIPVSELAGAGFAWHLHRDYKTGGGHQAMNFGSAPGTGPNGEAAPLMGSGRFRKSTACC